MEPKALCPVLQSVFAQKCVFLPSGEKTALHSNVSPEEALALYTVVRETRPAVSAEVGFAQGISALSILQALEENGLGEHHVVDPFQSQYGYAGVTMVERAGLEKRLRFYETFAEHVLPDLPPIQFAFIDASHLFDLSLVEFVLVDKKLEVGGLIGFHDMWMASLQKLLRYILSNRSYRIAPQAAARPPAEQNGRPSPQTRLKRAVRRRLLRWPRAEATFSAEFLRPWPTFGLSNLVFLEKTGEDTREWTFHRPF